MLNDALSPKVVTLAALTPSVIDAAHLHTHATNK
jgi:hypothetical protein